MTSTFNFYITYKISEDLIDGREPLWNQNHEGTSLSKKKKQKKKFNSREYMRKEGIGIRDRDIEGIERQIGTFLEEDFGTETK